MSYSKLANLVNILAKKTRTNEIDWEETANENAFQISFPKYSVIIDVIANTQQHGENDFRIQIIDDRGRIIESAVDPDFDGLIETPYKTMKEIYETARRQILGVENALDSIISNLTEDDVPF